MFCNCEEAYSLPECTDTITIGTLLPNTIYWIHIENTSSGYKYTQEVTSDALGVIVLDSTQPSQAFYNERSLYQISVTLPEESTTKNITIDAIAVQCIFLSFYKQHGEPTINATIKLIP